MDEEASKIIDGLGGTAVVARLTLCPPSTVHSWRKNGLSPSRKDHIRLAAKEEGLPWPLDIAALAATSPEKSAPESPSIAKVA